MAGSLKCPHCGERGSEVIDSRLSSGGISEFPEYTWRRRRCKSCQKRFTTFEGVKAPLPMGRPRKTSPRGDAVALGGGRRDGAEAKKEG